MRPFQGAVHFPSELVAKKSAGFILRPRLRVERGKEIALGPGKVELLEHIAKTGSITEAAERMQMSYMRAWTLIKTMEACFRQPLVEPAEAAAHERRNVNESGNGSFEALPRDGRGVCSGNGQAMGALASAFAPLSTLTDIFDTI